MNDHLGNNRVTFKDNNGTPLVVRSEDYYPFGATSRAWSTQTLAEMKFKYQGKERDTETGYDNFEARTYDPQLGRFLQVDPHFEKYVTTTPYTSMFGNPVLIIDPTVMDGQNHFDNFSAANQTGSNEEAAEIAVRRDEREKIQKEYRAEQNRRRAAEVQDQNPKDLVGQLKKMLKMTTKTKEAGASVVFNKPDKNNPEGSFEIVIFENKDNKDYHATLPKLDGSPEEGWTYKGKEVVADIHTHFGTIPNPSDVDRDAFESNKLPGIILTTSGLVRVVNSLIPEEKPGRENRAYPIPSNNTALRPQFNSLRRKP